MSRRGRARPLALVAVAIVSLVSLVSLAACKRGGSPSGSDASATTSAAAVDAAAAVLAKQATPDASSAPPPAPADPYGAAREVGRVLCAGVAGRHVAERDLRTSFVDGDDLLALVNRAPTGQLPPDYAPSDLVDLRDGTPKTSRECDKLNCLRKDAAAALAELMAEMKQQGFPGKVESAYRSYGAQCGTFLNWARKGGFCEATEQSALPGHSQHQLGTTVDLFTEEWAKDEHGVFRAGFGCTPAGKFLQEHAWDFGFVMPYPIHPDDRHPKQSCVVRWDIPVNINPKTGYRYEHWHIRYVGKDAAKRFHAMLDASGLGTPDELTVEQWLRREKGFSGPDAELPVCDGCNCGACSTLAAPGESACDKRGGALHLDAHGNPLVSGEAPAITRARRGSARRWHGAIVEVSIDVPPGVLTQPPIVGPNAGGLAIGYAEGATFDALAPYPETKPRAFAPLAGAWVVAVEPVPNTTGKPWPWRAALTLPTHAQIYDRANVALPARTGKLTVKVPVPAGVSRAKVVLLESGTPRGPQQTVDLR